MKYWLGEIKKNGNEDVPKIIVGNKADLEAERVVSTEAGRAFAESQKIPFLETSAKGGDNVTDLFTKMTQGYLKQAMTQAAN